MIQYVHFIYSTELYLKIKLYHKIIFFKSIGSVDVSALAPKAWNRIRLSLDVQPDYWVPLYVWVHVKPVV